MPANLPRHLLEITKIDVAAYHQELQAVDDALRRAAEVSPELFQMRPSQEIDSDPAPPVAGKCPVRTAVALLQHLAWAIAEDWNKEVFSGSKFFVLYPMCSRVLKRRLRPDAATAADLVRLVVMPPAAHPRHDFLPQVLKIIEANFPPPVPSVLRSPLHQLASHLKKHGKYLYDTRASERINKLLADSSNGHSGG